jgi:Cys-tRNA(Pro) deacylase
MSVEDVRLYFTNRGLQDPTFKLEESGATVDEAAKSIGVEPASIAKTLAFRLKEEDIIIVTRGDAKIDNKKYKEFFKEKARMLEHDEVEKVTGHPVGGLCPFGLRSNLKVYIDVSIKNFEYVYPAAGSRFMALKITPGEIVSLVGAQWVDVCKF